MSSPIISDEDEVEEEVEFVSVAPRRPVLECIDLLSDNEDDDDEDEGCSSNTGSMKDKINLHKARVTSTLDKLAQQVALEKKQRADKCRAFKEKLNLQKAHGRQLLSLSPANGEAKRCVDMWLKMPGPRPGSVGPDSWSGRKRRHAPLLTNCSTRHVCPVLNCCRVYDHTSLLDGHLKRFDHSPCDPSLQLKGDPSELFACVACGLRFDSNQAWRKHLENKVDSSAAENHSITQRCQKITCFACPACYLLFNLRDECLQHMSAKNHFRESLVMTETRGAAQPVPVPQFIRKRFIGLCKEVGFKVHCSLCSKVLTSHQAAQAHFNVQCRQGSAVAKADKTIVQVMKELQVRGQCSLCCLLFHSRDEIQRHQESTLHDVEINLSMDKALLQHCRFGDGQEAPSCGFETPKRMRKSDGGENVSSKRQRLSASQSSGRSGGLTSAWFCECGQQFSEEAAAKKHLLAVNQIFHQCGVCGKLMGESSITRLHMSRFHGGAHLSNFLFFCRKCKVEMPRSEDILLHVSEAHVGHTFFAEQEVSEADAKVADEKPSTSSDFSFRSSSKFVGEEPSSSQAEQSWMCRMCEDVFNSELAVHKHCSDLSVHSFQRFICGHCPQKFFKESTVRRHCVNEHDGQIASSHFCGLCDSMPFESEDEFLEHYGSLHSKDYYCMDDRGATAQPAVAESTSRDSCPCMSLEKSARKMKATYTQCMRDLAADGRCRYVCAPCDVTLPSFAQMKTHVHTKHAALHLDMTFDVECKMCSESFAGVPSFHIHYHSRHCALEPCTSSRTNQKHTASEAVTVTVVDAVEVKPEDHESEDKSRETVCFVSPDSKSGGNENRRDNNGEVRDALSMVEEEDGESAEMEEALRRSLLEF